MSYLPPGVTSGSLAGFPLITYWNTAIQEWQANTPALSELCDFKPLPRRSGRTQQFYGQKPFTASTQTVSEGIPPSSESLSQVTSDVFADEFGNWIGISNIVNMMFINDGVTDATRNLAYQGALSGNQVAFNAFDADAAANSVARIDLGDNEFLLSSTMRSALADAGTHVPKRYGISLRRKRQRMIDIERARAERLGHLTQSPGWPDLIKILNDLVNEQVSAVNAFTGWDKDQKADLMTRQQTVIQMREELIKRVEKILLAQFQPTDNNTEQDATLADDLRKKFLNETRIPGTYEV